MNEKIPFSSKTDIYKCWKLSFYDIFANKKWRRPLLIGNFSIIFQFLIIDEFMLHINVNCTDLKIYLMLSEPAFIKNS